MNRTSGSKTFRLLVWSVFSALAALIVPAAQGLEPGTPLSQYAHKTWRLGDAGLLGTPQSVTQTQDGYIWVSTSNGLFRFDGVRFAKWEPPPGESLPSNSLWYLFGARNGSLYVGTDLGLARISAGHVYTYPDSPRWPGPFVEDAHGDVWMGVSGSHSPPSPICKIGVKELECFGAHEGFPCGRGLSNVVTTDGHLWIGTNDGTCRWREGEPSEMQPIPALRRQKGLRSVTSLATTIDGELWAGTQHAGTGEGLLRFANGAWSTYVGTDVYGATLSVSALHSGKGNVLWIGTMDKGLYRLFRGRLDHFDVTNGLSGRRILSILEDHEGGLWVATPMGVDFFRDYAVLNFTSNEGTLDDRARSVAVDRTDSVYLGGDALLRVRRGVVDQVKDENAKPIRDVQALFADSIGNLWIGAGNHLFVVKSDGSTSEIKSFSQSGAEIAVYITEDLGHDIWASVEDLRLKRSSLVRIHDGEIVRRYNEPESVGHQVMNALAADPDGGLWVGGALHGLYRFHNARFERVFASEFNARVENMLPEADGAIWLVTPSGFFLLLNGKIKQLSSANGLPCDGAVNIQDSPDGAKWFYMHCGIMRVSDETISAWWRGSRVNVDGKFFGPLEGARPNLFDGSPARTSDGKLWSANGYDFQVIDPNHLPFNPIPPPVGIEMVLGDGKELIPDHELRLAPKTREVQIDYTGLSFQTPEQVQFRYRLIGHDNIWIDAGTRRQAFYNDLKPGHYVFQVIASNNDGVWNTEGAKISFNVQPAWYQTLLFRVFAVLLLTALAIAVYSVRLNRYALSLKIRFDERLDERTRLARDLHDTLLQTIQGSKLVADNARDQAGNPPSTVRALNRLSEWLDRAINEGRDALEALRSSASEFDSLAASLRRATEDCSFDSQIKANVVTLGIDRELHPIARDEVYRIGYEAIRNACLHSGGTELNIEIRYRRRSLRLNVQDNGRGIDTAFLNTGKAGHFGLIGMKERASSMGGTLNIVSKPDQGTVISLLVPGSAVYANRLGRPRVYLAESLQRFRSYLLPKK